MQCVKFEFVVVSYRNRVLSNNGERLSNRSGIGPSSAIRKRGIASGTADFPGAGVETVSVLVLEFRENLKCEFERR